MIVSEGVTIPKNAEAFVAGQPSQHRGSREDEWPNFSGWSILYIYIYIYYY